MSLLDDARSVINEVDEQMAKLFEKRMQAVEQVAAYKQEHQLPVLDDKREHVVLERNTAFIKEEKYKESYTQFMQDLLAISRRYQTSILSKDIIGFQGVEGAFSNIASQKIFPDHKMKRYATFEDVCKAVCSGEIQYGVLPIENSYTGEVGEVLDLLMKYDVYIQGDYHLKISQNLLGVKGAKLSDIKQVYSKDQAINQSKQFLEGRGYELIPYLNTAMAAEYVAKQNDITKAAIAAKETAELYGLDILAENINTSNQNTTRFIIIGNKLKKEGNVFSVAFIVPHKAGALVAAMNIISKRGFNMQSIISRSIKDRPWEYYFYVEIEGNLDSEKEKELLKEMQGVCESIKVLGTYTKESRDEI